MPRTSRRRTISPSQLRSLVEDHQNGALAQQAMGSGSAGSFGRFDLTPGKDVMDLPSPPGPRDRRASLSLPAAPLLVNDENGGMLRGDNRSSSSSLSGAFAKPASSTVTAASTSSSSTTTTTTTTTTTMAAPAPKSNGDSRSPLVEVGERSAAAKKQQQQQQQQQRQQQTASAAPAAVAPVPSAPAAPQKNIMNYVSHWEGYIDAISLCTWSK
jgi:hypothetical protein